MRVSSLRGIVSTASVQGHVGPASLLTRIQCCFQFLGLLSADSGYQGEVAALTAPKEPVASAIVALSDQTSGLILLPKRWIVERNFIWFVGNPRLAKDGETLIANSNAMLNLAPIRLPTRRMEIT